ncbi:hypothetical protein [Streptomyces sp. Ac-502]|uniref:hypothetical protein n=1 Tax=Streptomyces sp. Ac-502 TaxID=3342801 RepID=UPI003862C523
MDYDFTFVVTGATVDDQDAVDALRDTCDALLARAGGTDLLSIAWPGDCAVRAALEAASAAHAAVPRLRVRRLDRDLVGIHEIAERTGRSRQNVAQWAAGARKAQGAPSRPPRAPSGAPRRGCGRRSTAGSRRTASTTGRPVPRARRWRRSTWRWPAGSR